MNEDLKKAIITDGIEELQRCSAMIEETASDTLIPHEKAALARMLYAYHSGTADKDDAAAAYRGVVDFLWMAFRISHIEKMDLLDLL